MNRRPLNTSDLLARAPRCCGDCAQGHRKCAVPEACQVAEHHGRERMGGFKGWERALLDPNVKPLLAAAGSIASFVFLLWATKP